MMLNNYRATLFIFIALLVATNVAMEKDTKEQRIQYALSSLSDSVVRNELSKDQKELLNSCLMRDCGACNALVEKIKNEKQKECILLALQDVIQELECNLYTELVSHLDV